MEKAGNLDARKNIFNFWKNEVFRYSSTANLPEIEVQNKDAVNGYAFQVNPGTVVFLGSTDFCGCVPHVHVYSRFTLLSNLTTTSGFFYFLFLLSLPSQLTLNLSFTFIIDIINITINIYVYSVRMFEVFFFFVF